MKTSPAWILILILGLVGCGDESSTPPPPGTSAPEGDTEDLTRRWGPDVMPDREAEPLMFFYWRIDQLYDREDLDMDGRLTKEEFLGEEHNFDRIDGNGDGFLTKQEFMDDFVPKMRERGEIP